MTKSKKKKVTYNQLTSYVNFLESKLNYNINVLSKTLDHYINFKKDDKKFANYLEKKYPKNDPVSASPKENNDKKDKKN